MLSCYSENKLYLSGVLVAGDDPSGDSEVLQMFRQAMESNSLFKQVARGKAEPLTAIVTRPERPFLAYVIWPILSAECVFHANRSHFPRQIDQGFHAIAIKVSTANRSEIPL